MVSLARGAVQSERLERRVHTCVLYTGTGYVCSEFQDFLSTGTGGECVQSCKPGVIGQKH